MKKKRGKRIFLNKSLKKKKGLSTIVVTLILVLLSLVAIGVVWVVVRNVINTGSKGINLGQFTISLDIKSAYEQNGNINVDVKRNAGAGDLTQIKFVLSDGTNSEVITKNSSLGELEEANFVLTPSSLNASNVQIVSITPVFKANDGTETVGTISDTYNLVSGQSTNSGEQSGNEGNNNNSTCTPDCTNLECGPDPICGNSCGTCSGSDNCTNGVCVPVNCVDESNVTTCGTWVCGTKINNCGKIITCGSNGGNCTAGHVCTLGSCVAVIPVNSGHVNDTWPGTSGMYFASPDLPKTVSYQGYYVSFPGSAETGCKMIILYSFPPSEGYPDSHIGLNSATQIVKGDNYRIWSSLEQCEAGLSL